jgi:hypothetical protein
LRRSQLPDTINNIALQIVENRIKRHAFLLALAVIGISIMSYHFGTFDQSIHIPFLKAAADPTLYPNDPFVALRHEHYSYFWLMFIPFYQLGVLEETLFIVHVIITYFTYWTIYKLGWTLFQKPTSAMFATLAFVFPHASFCGFPLIEFSLLNRTFVLPFLILAINLYLRGIRARSFFMLGILYNLHVLSVHFVLAMFALDFILEYRKIGWKKILNCIVVFIIAALPVLLWKLQDSGTEIQLEPGWFDLITRTMMMHVFFLFGNIYVTAASLSALSAYILFFIAYRAKSVKTETDHTVLIFVLASTLVVLAEVIVAAWFPISIILQLQIMRAGIFAVFFAYLYFGDYLAKKWTGDSIRRAGDGVVTMTFFLSTLTFVTAILILLQKWWSASQRRVTRIAIALAIGFIGSLIFAVVANVWYPGIHIYGLDNTWRDTQEWARNHTSNDAIFITPLNKWWLDEAEWRVFSERQNVTALSEILEASFEPEYIDHWRARMETLAPGAIDQFRGNYLINQQIAGTLYNSLSTDALLDAACTFNAGYIVVEKDHPHELTKVYENADYIIYDVRAACK